MTLQDIPYVKARRQLIAACDRLEGLLLGLQGSKGRIVDEIEAVREAAESLRGALMIAGEPKPSIRCLAVMGRLLDHVSRPGRLERCWSELGFEVAEEGAIEQMIAAMLSQQARMAARVPPEEVVDWAKLAVSRIRTDLEWAEDDEFAQRIQKGAERMSRRVVKRAKRVVSMGEDRDFQEMRRSQRFWTQGMKVAFPGVLLVAGEALESLGRLLDEEHDLEQLSSWLTQSGFSSSMAPAVRKRIPKLASGLRRHSLRAVRGEVLPCLKSTKKGDLLWSFPEREASVSVQE